MVCLFESEWDIFSMPINCVFWLQDISLELHHFRQLIYSRQDILQFFSGVSRDDKWYSNGKIKFQPITINLNSSPYFSIKRV